MQTLIPLAVAEVIVVGLELVHVYHQYCQYPLMTARPLPLPLHGDVPLTAVGDPGQGILQRQQGETPVGLLQRPVGVGQLPGPLLHPQLQVTVETLERRLGALADQQLGEHGGILLEDLALIRLERTTPEQVVGGDPADGGAPVPERHHGIPAAPHHLLLVIERGIFQHQHIILASQRLLHRGMIRNGADEMALVDELTRLVGTPGTVHGLELTVRQEDGDAIELQLLARQHHRIVQQAILTVTARQLDSYLVQCLQHAEEGVLQGLAADEIGLGIDPLIPLQIDLTGESPALQLGGEVVHQQLDALLLTPWQAIEAAPGFQIDHGLQPLVALEREACTQAWALRLDALPDGTSRRDRLHQQLAEIEGTFNEEERQVEGGEHVGAQTEQALLRPVVVELGRWRPQPQIDLLGLGLFSDRRQRHFTEMFKTGEVLRIPFLHAKSSLVVSKRVYRQSLAIN